MEPVTYISSLLTFYIKGEISSQQNFIRFKEPNTILGLIPLGAKNESVPITQITSTKSNFKMRFGKLILGIIIAVLGLTLFQSTFIGGLIVLIIGANAIIDAFEIDLQVFMTSGQIKSIDFFIFEKQKAELAEREILAMISNRLDDTNNRQQTDRIVDAINNSRG